MSKPPVELDTRDFLERRMVSKGWTHSDLVREAAKHLPEGKELTRQHVRNYVEGLHLPSPERLAAMAKALGCETTDLTEGGRDDI